MNSVELLRQTLDALGQLGYSVRQEWLDGQGGGACQFAGKKWIFLDFAWNVEEQLDQVIEVLRSDPNADQLCVSDDLRKLLGVRKAA